MLRGFFCRSGAHLTETRMRIGVPRETRIMEGRVALVPAAAGDLVRRGHEVWVERGAGQSSGFSDSDYERLGVRIAADAPALYGHGQLIVKVKEPIAGDLALLRHGLDYYPKLLCAVPYSPVTGPRLMAPTPKLRRALADALAAEAVRLGCSS